MEADRAAKEKPETQGRELNAQAPTDNSLD
jgi:hypothetical protein